ncbi:hypothetical protein IV203_002185 [Nitzschia inconspicua]|uniref:Uncharacterized protein n=1 Tax=Nitzschia inconspicua TaxID=303405 RepID=A0A9K3L8K4_9STRA|nr:hypothetical protein IV203_002185 [Nitzschia inconspicua]
MQVGQDETQLDVGQQRQVRPFDATDERLFSLWSMVDRETMGNRDELLDDLVDDSDEIAHYHGHGQNVGSVNAPDDDSTLSDSTVESPVDVVPVLSVSLKSYRRGRDKAKNDVLFNNILAKKTKILAEIRTEERRKADAMRMNNWLAMLRDPNIPDRLKEISFDNVEEEVQKSRREREGAPGRTPLSPPTAVEAHENDDIAAEARGYEGTAAL